MKPRAVIYARISSVRKGSDVEKVPAQVRLCEELAEREGYEVVGVFREADGTSATSGKPRPEFERMVASIEAGEVDVVVATETERLVRDELDGLRLRMACAGPGARWHTVRGGDIDVASSSGSMLAGIKALIGRYESSSKAERQRAAYQRLREAGRPHPGPRIFGWKEGREEAEPVEAAMVREGSEHVVAGGSMYALVQRWKASGVRTTRGGEWTYQGVKQVLSRPKNCGRVVHEGDVLPVAGQWEALVSPELFDAVIATFEDRVTNRVPETRWCATGIALCGVCGAPLRGTKANGRPYARCQVVRDGGGDGRRHVGVPMEDLEAAVRAALAGALLMASGNPEGEASELSDLHGALREVRESIGRLVAAVAEGALSSADVAPRRRELEAREEALRAAIREASVRDERAGFLAEVRADLWSGHTVNLEEAAEVRGRIRERLDELPVHVVRALVESMLHIEVNPGRGPGRIEVTRLGEVEEVGT